MMMKRLKLAIGLILACLVAGLAALYLMPPPSAAALIASSLPPGAKQISHSQEGPHLLQLHELPQTFQEANAFYNDLFDLTPGDPQVTVRGAIFPGILDYQTLCSATAPGEAPSRLFLRRTPHNLLTIQISAPSPVHKARLVISCVLAKTPGETSAGLPSLSVPVSPVTQSPPAYAFTNATMKSFVGSERISAYNLVTEAKYDQVVDFYGSQTNPIPFNALTTWSNAAYRALVFYRLTGTGLDLVTLAGLESATNLSLQAILAR